MVDVAFVDHGMVEEIPPPPPLAIEPDISSSKGSPHVCGGQKVVSLMSFPRVARFLNSLR